MALVPVGAGPPGGGALAPSFFKTLGSDFFGDARQAQRRASYTARQAEMRTHGDRMNESVVAARCCERSCIETVLRDDGAALAAWRLQWGLLTAPQREEALLQHVMQTATRGVVRLFNAESKAQKAVADAGKRKGGLLKPKELTKGSFLAELKKSGERERAEAKTEEKSCLTWRDSALDEETTTASTLTDAARTVSSTLLMPTEACSATLARTM